MQGVNRSAECTPADPTDPAHACPCGWARGGGALLDAGPVNLCFGRFEVHPQERRLLVDGNAVDLGSRAFDVLLMLAESGGPVLTKGMILDQVWADVVVEENNHGRRW